MSEKTKQEIVNKLPEEFKAIVDIAYNLWWSWQPEARQMFKELDPPLWHKTRHNPVEMLRKISEKRINELKTNKKFLSKFKKVLNDFQHLKNNNDSLWFENSHPQLKKKVIAYLSMEYGIHNSVKIYSGGLGILAGDHLKEASDLGIPITAVGFLYQEGYFTQKIALDGLQQAIYRETDFQNLPITEVKDPSDPNNNLLIPINFNNIIVKVKIWKLDVGRVILYLMDSNIDANPPWDRNLTDRLYGGSQELRLKQEMILGLGSVRLFNKLAIKPAIYHLNEGHCSFSIIERIHEWMKSGKSFHESVNTVRLSTIFTTHTPVPAGHDVFPYNLIETYFNEIYIRDIGREEFFSLGSYKFSESSHQEGYNMTVLGMRSSKYINSVSKLHKEVSFNMFKPLWDELKEKYSNEFIPIIHITNGIHVPSFVSENIQELLDSMDTNWRVYHDDPNYWKTDKNHLQSISDEMIWRYHLQSKDRLFRLIRENARSKIKSEEWGSEMSLLSGVLLDPKVLTFGFARRFATYKRATLIFKDFERLLNLVNDEYKPIQIIFAGKAHPADEPGKKLIQDIINHAKNTKLAHRIAFIEDYSLSSAKMLLQGVDIWLNNPIRPNEASGTSGMKASCNFVPNLSILDGWWAEGYNGQNGWTINAENREFADFEEQSDFDAKSLYEVIEKEILPIYYNHGSDSNIPEKFIKVMREALVSVLPNFSARRMVKDYVNQLYSPALKNSLSHDSTLN